MSQKKSRQTVKKKNKREYYQKICGLTQLHLVFGCLLHDLLCVSLKCQGVHTWLVLTPLVFGTLIMTDLQLGVCASLLQASEAKRQNKRLERELWDKWRKGDSAWCHFVRSHRLSECINPWHALAHTDTQRWTGYMYPVPAAWIYRNSSTVWLN